MRYLRTQAGCVLGVLLLTACTTGMPPNRIADYVGTPKGTAVTADLSPQGIQAGLVVIPDTSAPEASPVLPDEAIQRLAESLSEELKQTLPITIAKIVPAEGLRPVSGGDPDQFAEFGRKQGVEYLIVVVASATEVEYPQTLFLGWAAHMQPGLRRDNYSLLEAALVDVKAGQTLVRAEGRGWATLDRPMAPGINQWYPVVWLRPMEPNRRYWPPTFEGAPNTLRVISMEDASKRLLLNLRKAWGDK
ncbi:MAG: hypothetical protein ACKOBZ_04245 [Nitrospira sp.]|nr:hypothetical protein [Nitrospira sp.]